MTVAEDFTVQYMDSYKVLDTFPSLVLWLCRSVRPLVTSFDLQVVSNLFVNETYVLYQCGTTPPSSEIVPAGAKFFQIPLTSISVIETVPYAYLVGLHTLKDDSN